jgi:hypothetical protein
LLGECLSFDLRGEALSRLRVRLLSGRGVWDQLLKLALENRLEAALADRLESRGLVPAFPVAGTPPGATLSTVVQGFRERNDARRTALRAHLRSIVRQFNSAGLEPILLKGARSLWTGEPHWRSLRDLDLLLAGEEAIAAQRVLLAAGFHPLPGRRERPRRHHLEPLFRGDLEGWIEVHRRGGNAYCERLLPTRELEESAVRNMDGDMVVRLLSRPAHALHAMIHHHVGHSGYARGTLSVKGLYEFACEMVAIEPAERRTLVVRAAKSPRLATILDLWNAAAVELFAMPTLEPIRIASDARTRLTRMLDRLDSGSSWKYPGYSEEIAMALAADRIGVASGGAGWIGRQALRARTLLGFIPSFRF